HSWDTKCLMLPSLDRRVLDGLYDRFEILVQPDLLMNDLTLFVQHGDEVGVGELAGGFLLVFHPEQRREFERVVGPGAQKRPVAGGELLAGAVSLQGSRRVAFGIESDEQEAGFGAY